MPHIRRKSSYNGACCCFFARDDAFLLRQGLHCRSLERDELRLHCAWRVSGSRGFWKWNVFWRAQEGFHARIATNVWRYFRTRTPFDSPQNADQHRESSNKEIEVVLLRLGQFCWTWLANKTPRVSLYVSRTEIPIVSGAPPRFQLLDSATSKVLVKSLPNASAKSIAKASLDDGSRAIVAECFVNPWFLD